MVDMYKKAFKKRLRISTSKGNITVEDLMTLSLEDVNNVAKKYNKIVKDNDEEDFLSTSSARKSKIVVEAQLIVDICKDIISDKETAKKRAAERAKIEENKAMLKGLLETKNMEELSSMSKQQIADKLAELSANSLEEEEE